MPLTPPVPRRPGRARSHHLELTPHQPLRDEEAGPVIEMRQGCLSREATGSGMDIGSAAVHDSAPASAAARRTAVVDASLAPADRSRTTLAAPAETDPVSAGPGESEAMPSPRVRSGDRDGSHPQDIQRPLRGPLSVARRHRAREQVRTSAVTRRRSSIRSGWIVRSGAGGTRGRDARCWLTGWRSGSRPPSTCERPHGPATTRTSGPTSSPSFGQVRLDAIRPVDVASWVAELTQPGSRPGHRAEGVPDAREGPPRCGRRGPHRRHAVPSHPAPEGGGR